jgi:ribose 5-phosphate isomerase B
VDALAAPDAGVRHEVIKMRIALATDHAGYHLKEKLKTYLKDEGYDVDDFGTDSDISVDYPDYICPAARSVAEGKQHLGIVLGGSGNGDAMAANKIKGIRCALCWSENSARLAKEHNNANFISIGARMVSEIEAINIVGTWLQAEFEGGRHIQRIEKLNKLGEQVI